MLSDDPVIQFCATEAVMVRLGKVRADHVERQAATETALARARADVNRAVGR